MRITAVLFLLLTTGILTAQSMISGMVLTTKEVPLPGANIFIEGSFDGATSDPEGNFSFYTNKVGSATLIARFVGFETVQLTLELPGDQSGLEIRLKEVFSRQDGVTISAGAFEASDEKKGTIFKPLDIAMTAGATADIAGALNTLPGTQTVGESGRLFVRGGGGRETQAYIDGAQVRNFYNTTPANVPARSRFSPFMFKGTLFSTGGYSAEYGQALSSVLSLNTENFPEESQTDLSLMSVGLGVAHTISGESMAITGEVNYSNLSPYMSVVPQEIEWNTAPESFDGAFSFRKKADNGTLLKVYGRAEHQRVGISRLDDITLNTNEDMDIQNRFYYLNTSLMGTSGKQWTWYAGSSFGYNRDVFDFGGRSLTEASGNLHLKNTWTYDWSEKLAVRFGGEYFLNNTDFTFIMGPLSMGQSVEEHLGGAFIENDVYLTKKISARVGLRLDYSSFLEELALGPRFSMAYKTGQASQVSLAYGTFFQTPQEQFLWQNLNLEFEKADHYILSYQHSQKGRTFRAEAYHKQYDRLIRFDPMTSMLHTGLESTGTGYANGLDIFWRDQKTIKNADYWVSYSFLDTRRLAMDFQEEAVPSFASAHNFSLVTKYFVAPVKTQAGFTFSYTSPRPFHDPNQEGFMNGQTPAFMDLSFNAAYLYRPHVIFYISATNLLGRENIFGYRHALQPDGQGHYPMEAVGQPALRFLFLGIFITLSKDKTKNQLDQL